MPHLPGNFNSGTLTQPNEVYFTCTTRGIPGHTTHSVDHAQNSWAYSWQSCNHHMIYCTGRCDFCAHADLLSQPMCALSNIKMARQDIVKTLEYSPVVKIPESEGLLVWHSSARLGEYRLNYGW